MGRNWNDLSGFGRWLIATATTTAAQLFQFTKKSQQDTTDRDKNTHVTNNYNKTIIDNRSINNFVIQQRCPCCQQCHQEGARDLNTSKCQQPEIGFESPFE